MLCPRPSCILCVIDIGLVQIVKQDMFFLVIVSSLKGLLIKEQDLYFFRDHFPVVSIRVGSVLAYLYAPLTF